VAGVAVVEELGVAKNTIYRYMKKLGISKAAGIRRARRTESAL
jgi:transcription initiation factor IIE alpha subunit